jgi:hypothetical protein
MKRNVIIITLASILIIIFGVATNPSYADYKEWYKQQAQEGFTQYKEGKETTEFEKSVMNFMVEMIADTSVIREDYKLYSLYRLENEEYKYKVLGLFNNFFVLEDENYP